MPSCFVQRWSLSLGRWWGVPVYLHSFFLFAVLLALAFNVPEPDLLSVSVLMIAVLLVSVTLHEVGHALAAIRFGGKIDAIVIGPVGGLISPRVPDEPEIRVFVALAGPMVHLAIAVVAASALAIAGDRQLLELLNPLATPPDLVVAGAGSWGIVTAKLTLWLNWTLMLLNLLPAYPFDGGPVMRAMLWPALGRRSARIVTARVAMVLAVLICVAGVFTLGSDLPTHVPAWIPLVTLGLFLFFSARQDLSAAEPQENADAIAGYQLNSDGLDLLDAMWSSEDDEVVLVEHQQRPTERNSSAPEQSEDDRVDAILARLHDTSMDELSPEEVEVLQRASQRYRRRRGVSDD
jgi:Zn-dependent protease